MTDKQIIKTFRNISKYCDKTECVNCFFLKERQMKKTTFCQIRGLALYLSDSTPNCWEMEEIERIINE